MLYVVVLLNSDGYFDPELNDVIGPFASKDEAEEWARGHVPEREVSVEELAKPYGGDSPYSRESPMRSI
jgi:hypothetical protein